MSPEEAVEYRLPAKSAPGPSPELLATMEKTRIAIEALGKSLRVTFDVRAKALWFTNDYVVHFTINDNYYIEFDGDVLLRHDLHHDVLAVLGIVRR
jgi:hypothetical protein